MNNNYSTNFSRSSKDHRIANVYNLYFHVLSNDGSPIDLVKHNVIIPWEHYSSNGSLNSNSFLNSFIMIQCFSTELINLGFDDGFFSNNIIQSSFSGSFELLDRIDQPPSLLDDFNSEYFSYS